MSRPHQQSTLLRSIKSRLKVDSLSKAVLDCLVKKFRMFASPLENIVILQRCKTQSKMDARISVWYKMESTAKHYTPTEAAIVEHPGAGYRHDIFGQIRGASSCSAIHHQVWVRTVCTWRKLTWDSKPHSSHVRTGFDTESI